MPWTLYRFVLKDLLRLLVITSAVLILLMAVAAAVPYLSDGLLGPLSMIKFITYTSPTMLSVALPFAGAFVGTMVFNRMVSDREVLICRACGLNYMLILLPVGFLGVIAMVGMFYLSNWLIPEFYERAEHTLEKDIVSIVVRKVQNGEPLQHGDLIIHADAAAQGEPPKMQLQEGIEPQSLIALRGVAVAKLGDDGRMTAYGTAERADMLLYHAANDSFVMLRLKNARYHGEEESGGQGMMDELPLGPYSLENPYRERIRFFSMGELRRLNELPENQRYLRQLKSKLVTAVARQELIRKLRRGLDTARGDGKVTLAGSLRGERFTVVAPFIREHRDGLELLASGRSLIEIDQFAHGVISERKYRAKRAVVTIDAQPSAEPRVSIRLFDLKVSSIKDKGLQTDRRSLRLPLVRWPEDITVEFRSMTLLKLKAYAMQEHASVASTDELIGHISAGISKVLNRAVAHLHERAALSLGCLLMVLLGAILAMKMENKLPLQVYLWTFLLAVLSVIVTRTGVRLVDTPTWTLYVGLAVIWTGNLIVVAAIVTSYWQLERS